MKNALKTLIKIMNVTIVLLILTCLFILIYPKLGLDKKGEQSELGTEEMLSAEIPGMAESVTIPETQGMADDGIIPETQGVPEQDVLPETQGVPEQDVLPEFQGVPETGIMPENQEMTEPVTLPENQGTSEQMGTMDEAQALNRVNSELSQLGNYTTEYRGIETIDGKSYFVIGLVDSEGQFYVSTDGREIYLSVGDIVLEPFEKHKNLFGNAGDFYEVVLNGLVSLSPNGCLIVDGFRHGMSFNESMNKVLENAGIYEDISNYKGIMYNTTGENILEISPSSMYDRTIGNADMCVSLIYDGVVSGENRIYSSLTGVQLKIAANNENLLNYSGDENQIVGEFIKILGNNYTYSELGDTLRAYVWRVGGDKVYLCFREYYGIRTGNGDEEIEKWVLHRLEITHVQ